MHKHVFKQCNQQLKVFCKLLATVLVNYRVRQNDRQTDEFHKHHVYVGVTDRAVLAIVFKQ